MATFVVMFAVWILFSGRFDAFHLFLGVISCAIIAAFSGDLLFGQRRVRRTPIYWYRFILYIPWLLAQIFRANLHVLNLVFHPRMAELIDPQIFHFKSRLTSDMSIVTLANSITLTPGTITVYISVFGDVTVHAIDKESAAGLPGEMEDRIAKIFEE